MRFPVKRPLVVASTAALGLVLLTGTARAEPPGWWHAPRCTTVDSDGSLSYTRDAGHTIAPTTGIMHPVKEVSDVATLARPNQLLAVDFTGRLYFDREAGCDWMMFYVLDGQAPWKITPAPDGTAYVWSKANDNRLYRVDGTTVTELPRLPDTQYGPALALTVDHWNARHVRVVTQNGIVLDSRDGGQSWRQVGDAPAPILNYGPTWAYDAAIWPGDLDRITLGTVVDGIFTSTDGGRHWRHAALGAAGDRINAFTVAVSPASPWVVWAMGLDMTEMDATPHPTSDGRHLYRSTDGGRTFRPFVDQGMTTADGTWVTITNGLPLVPSPVDPDQVYFEFGTWFGGYGTDLFAWNARSRHLSVTHNSFDDINAIAFNPADPHVMYLGLVREGGGW
jgi:photosystem II stability/assembly factor-like uncharacterized protein